MAPKGICEICGFSDDSYRIEENGTVMKVCKLCHDGYLERMGLPPDADAPITDVASMLDLDAIEKAGIDTDGMTGEELLTLKLELEERNKKSKVPTLDASQLDTLLGTSEDDKKVLSVVRQKEARRRKRAVQMGLDDSGEDYTASEELIRSGEELQRVVLGLDAEDDSDDAGAPLIAKIVAEKTVTKPETPAEETQPPATEGRPPEEKSPEEKTSEEKPEEVAEEQPPEEIPPVEEKTAEEAPEEAAEEAQSEEKTEEAQSEGKTPEETEEAAEEAQSEEKTEEAQPEGKTPEETEEAAEEAQPEEKTEEAQPEEKTPEEKTEEPKEEEQTKTQNAASAQRDKKEETEMKETNGKREKKAAVTRAKIHAEANQKIDDERIRITSPEIALETDTRPKTNLDVAVSQFEGGVRFLNAFKYVLHRVSYAIFLGVIVLAVATVMFIREGWQHALIVLGGGAGAVLLGFLLMWYLSHCYETDRRALLLRIRQQEILFDSMNSECYRELRTKFTMIKALGWLLDKLSVILPLVVFVGGNVAAIILAFLKVFWLLPVISAGSTIAGVLIYYVVKFAADMIAYKLDIERNQQIQQQTLLDMLDRMKKDK